MSDAIYSPRGFTDLNECDSTEPRSRSRLTPVVRTRHGSRDDAESFACEFGSSWSGVITAVFGRFAGLHDRDAQRV